MTNFVSVVAPIVDGYFVAATESVYLLFDMLVFLLHEVFDDSGCPFA